MHQSEPAATTPVGQRLPGGYVDYQGMGHRQQLPVERKWALGLQVKLLSSLLLTISFWEASLLDCNASHLGKQYLFAWQLD